MNKKQLTRSGVILFILFLSVAITHPLAAADKKALQTRLVKEINAQAKASPKVKQFVIQNLLPTLTNPVFIKAVRQQNAERSSLDEIKKIDREWKDAEDILLIHEQKLNNPCADEIRAIQAKFPAIAETFVMDNQGANVCQNELTSDYWQGDEDKWINSFRQGKGGVDIGVEKLDQSTNIVLQQVSLPIIDNSGEVIGAITYGLKTETIR